MLTTPEVNEQQVWCPTPEELASWESEVDAAVDRELAAFRAEQTPEWNAACDRGLAEIRAKKTPEAPAEDEARNRRQAHEGAQLLFRIIVREIRALDRSRSWDPCISSAGRPRPRRVRRNIRRSRTRSGSRGSPGLGDPDPEPPSTTAPSPARRAA